MQGEGKEMKLWPCQNSINSMAEEIQHLTIGSQMSSFSNEGNQSSKPKLFKSTFKHGSRIFNYK